MSEVPVQPTTERMEPDEAAFGENPVAQRYREVRTRIIYIQDRIDKLPHNTEDIEDDPAALQQELAALTDEAKDAIEKLPPEQVAAIDREFERPKTDVRYGG